MLAIFAFLSKIARAATMYCIQSMPITNETFAGAANPALHEKISRQLSFDWLSPQQPCIFYDIVGRQLIKKNKNLPQSTTKDTINLETKTGASIESAIGSESANGFDDLRRKLARIDAHLYTFFVCSLLVDTATDSVVCRQCRKQSVATVTTAPATAGAPKSSHNPEIDSGDVRLFIYALHCVALEGSNRFYNGILDFVCIECAKELCGKTIGACLRGTPAKTVEAQKWTLSYQALALLETHKQSAKRLRKTDMYRLLFTLSKHSVGYEISHFQRIIDLFVQERFAAEQIELLHCADSAAADGIDALRPHRHCFLRISDVLPFLRCVLCSSDVTDARNTKPYLGVLSTMYYDTARIYAIPYFICGNETCRKTWIKPDFRASRFACLLQRHREAMRECFAQSLFYFSTIGLRLLGLDLTEFGSNNGGSADNFADNLMQKKGLFVVSGANSSSSNDGDDDNHKYADNKQRDHNDNGDVQNTLLLTVETDMLNQLFHLTKQRQESSIACATLVALQSDPCVQKLEQCLRRCLCDQCTAKNLLYIDMLLQYNTARTHSDSAAALESLNRIVEQFADACREPDNINDNSNKNRNENSNDNSSDNSNVHQSERRTGTCNFCHRQANNNCYDAQKRCAVVSPVDSFTACSSTVQNADRAHADWHLPPKPFGRTLRPRCGYEFDTTLLSSEHLEQFSRETCHFLSPML